MSSSGRSATAGSRLFMSIRRAASWCQPLQEMVVPVGAWMAAEARTVMPRKILPTSARAAVSNGWRESRPSGRPYEPSRRAAPAAKPSRKDRHGPSGPGDDTSAVFASHPGRRNPDRRSPMLLTLLLFSASVAGVPTQSAQGNTFRWHGPLAEGKTIEIVGVNGSIDASGREVEVVAEKRGRKSDPSEVEIRVVEHADGVTICAVYPPGSRDGRENECRPGGKGHNSTRDNDVTVQWTVKVPRGVLFTGRTVNGDVDARGLTAEAEARTVNGSITVETTSWADASTVNGSISARLGSTGWQGDLDFTTVNGRISVDLPESASMEVDASTVNGSMSTDFPLTVRGRWGPRHMSGTVGQGGRRLSLSTVNGSMELRRSP